MGPMNAGDHQLGIYLAGMLEGATPEQVDRTLGALLKYQEDLAMLRGTGVARILDENRR